jgi:hypothetical protein
MKRIGFLLLHIFIILSAGFGQMENNPESRILFHGIVMDAETLSPLSNSQIIINGSFSFVSEDDGTFALNVYRNDTVIFRRLGYKSTILFISDTLPGKEFIAGIYMSTDTLSIGEVVIIPRLTNLKAEILNTRPESKPELENARNNVALSAYQGINSQNKLGDPNTNYELLRKRQKVDAYEKGGIPSDKILSISPFLLVPAAYLFIHGFPEQPGPLKSHLTGKDLEQIQKKYLETLKKGK